MKYIVTISEDYSDNNGNPVNAESFEFDELEAAKTKQDELLKIEPEIGLSNTVTITDEGELTYIRGWNSGRNLKAEEVIVAFHHDTYIGYCYVIEDVRFADPENTTSDIQYDRDCTYKTVEQLFDNVEALQYAFDHRHGIFEKIKSGKNLIKEFIEENYANENNANPNPICEERELV